MAGGSRNWVLIPALSFRGVKAQAALLPQLDLLLVRSVGVQSLICHLGGTECPERSGLESPHDFSQRGHSLDGKEVAPSVSSAGARPPGGRICPLQLLPIGDFSHIYQLGAFLSVYSRTYSDTHVCAGADKRAHPSGGQRQPHVLFLRSCLFRFCFQSGPLLGLELNE